MPMTQVQREKFTTVLKGLNLPDAAQKILLEQADIAPAIADGYLAQAEFSRLSAETKTAKEAADALLAKNQKWFADTKPVFDEREKEVERLKADIAARTAAAAAGSPEGGDLNQDQINAIVTERLKGIQAPTQTQIATIVAEEVKKAADVERKAIVEQTLPAMFQANREYSEVMFNHQHEFNEVLPYDRLAEYMRANNIANIKEGYGKFADSVRADAKARQDAIDAGVKAELAKRPAPVAEIPGTGAYPGTGTRDLGPVQVVRANQYGKEGVTVGVLGDTSAAAAAANELAAEGKI